MELFAVAVLALAGGNVLFLVVLALRRVAVGTRERRRAELEERLRPIVIELLEDGRAPPALNSGESAVLAVMLGRYARRLRGDARVRIAEFFEASGGLREALDRLHDRRPWIRAEAAFALGDMGAGAAVPALLQALEDSDRDVRSAAARSLGRLGALDAVEPLLGAVEDGRIPRAVVGASLLAIGLAAIPRLRELVASRAGPRRAGAVRLVGLLGEAGDGRVLMGALLDESPDVRAQAATALGRLGAEDAADALRELLQDPVPFVRAAAATALGAIGDQAALESLLIQAREDVFEPAHAAAGAVARLDPARLRREAEDARHAGPHLVELADLAAS